MADNSSDKDELISQFMAFTGSSDPGKASSYLEMSGNNVETAVGLYMEHEQGGGGDSNVAGGGGGPVDNAAAAMMPPMGDDIRAPDATRTMRLMDDPMGMHHDPSYQLMNAMMEEQIAQSAFSAPAPAPLNARAALDAAIAAQGQGVNVEGLMQEDTEMKDQDGDENEEDDDDDSYEMPQEPARLSDMFAPPSHLMHKVGGFQGARAMAKDSRRWLLVNIQRDSEFASHALNRDVWRDELVENLVREGFIFWQAMDTTPEGRTYTERYQVQDYPHIGFIDPRTARLLWRKEGWTQENPVTAETFAESAMDFCSRNSFDRPPQAPRPAKATGAPVSVKRPVNEMSEDEQLQAAMRASMENVTGSAVTDDGNVVTQEEDEVQVVETKPEPEPAKPPSMIDELLTFPVPAESADGYRIQLRMPDGKRAVRRFSPSDPVRTIYAYVAQNNDDAKNGKEFILLAGYPPNDLVNSIDETVDAAKLKGEAITVRWK